MLGLKNVWKGEIKEFANLHGKNIVGTFLRAE